jgi:hypothetical protein
MSTMSRLGHSSSHKPNHTFIPVGITLAVVFLIGLTFLLWYGCGWLVNCEQLWEDARNTEDISSVAEIDAA